jgi:hypothetical protein
MHCLIERIIAYLLKVPSWHVCTLVLSKMDEPEQEIAIWLHRYWHSITELLISVC